MSSNIKHLKELLEYINAIVLVTDCNGKVLHANKLFLTAFEISQKDLSEKFYDKFVLYDVKNNPLKADGYPFIIAASKKESINNDKCKYIYKNGKFKWFSINSIVSFNNNKQVDSVINTFWDITERMEVEQYLNETLENIGSVFFSTNADGTEYLFISDTVVNIFGYSPKQIYEKRFTILKTINKEHFADYKAFIQKLKEGDEAVVEYQITDRFGKSRTIRHYGFPIIEKNEVKRVVGIIQDITNENKVRNELERSEERLKMLVETAGDLIFILNNVGHFVLVNKNGAGSLGYRPEELIGKHFFEFIEESKKDEIAREFEKILNTDGITSFETIFLDKEGNEIVFEIQARSTKSNGEISGLLSIGRNISGRKKDEEKLMELNTKLVEANRIISIERERAKHQIEVLEEVNKLKSQFVSNVSHELRTPLASIVGFAETISSDTDLPREMILEFSKIILTEGKRLAKLINDILDFSKLEVGEEELKKTSFDLIELSSGLVRSYSLQAEEKGIKVENKLPQAEIIINADKDRIANAIGHLLSNAIKFTKEGGKITVIIQDFLKEVEIIIGDTGIGIPEKAIPNLFQKFGKVDRPGTQMPGAGFGLVTVKKIVDLHKGVIQLKSEVDKGSTFIIRLPKQ